MRISLLFVILFVLTAVHTTASAKTITYYLDGSKIEYEAIAKKGYVEIHLPKDLVPGSLRVKPLTGTTIERVEIGDAKPDVKIGKEIAMLEERRNLLLDRVKALETREGIFKSAAKSQSGRAPRKTKNNPEPIANIRKGTEFAVNQLETVYTLRRKTEKELSAVEAKLTSLKGAGGLDGSIAKIILSAKGRVQLSYILSGQSWKPLYDFRLTGDGNLQMGMKVELSSKEGDASLFVVPAKMSDAIDVVALPVSKPSANIGHFSFPVEAQTVSPGALHSVKFTFKNVTNQRFLPGNAQCYLHGEYVGTIAFEGVGPKESCTLSSASFPAR